MGLASYKIFGVPGAWHVDHDGKAPNTYETKEAAFEAAVAAASLALRQGHEVSITAPGSNGSEATTGARDLK
jgi:phosphotransferase system HPr-like phosphotransfer protein